MPKQLISLRERYAVTVSISVLLTALSATAALAGWQRDMVCGAGSGGGCPGRPAPQIPRGSPRIQTSPTDDLNNEPSWSPPDPAEAERRQIDQDSHDKLVQSNWVDVSPMDAVSMPSSTTSVAPGSGIFDTVPSNPGSFTAPIALAMNGTPIPEVALRRATAILAAAEARLEEASNRGGEEVAFLASQAALALEGAPLQVIVVNADGAEAAKAAQAFLPIITDMAEHHADLMEGISTRQAALSAYREIQKQQDADGIDPPQNMERHHSLATTYDQASETINVARKKLADDNTHVRDMIRTTFVLDTK